MFGASVNNSVACVAAGPGPGQHAPWWKFGVYPIQDRD
jgi:hypothetical protein